SGCAARRERPMIHRAPARAAFDAVGLDALGPASGQLASLWAEAAPTFDATAMTMTVTSPARWHAMVGGGAPPDSRRPGDDDAGRLPRPVARDGGWGGGVDASRCARPHRRIGHGAH